MSELKERIALALGTSGKSKSGLARACGVASSSISAWCNGKTKVIAGNHAFKAASYLGVSVQWLTTGEGNMHCGSSLMIGDDSEMPNDLVSVPEYRVCASAGPGIVPQCDEVENSRPAAYRRELFLRHGVNPKNAKVFRVHGDSMMPVLWDGDYILVDCSQGKQLASGRVYAFTFNGELRVKRLIPLLNGGLIVRSDNPQVPEERLEPDMLDCFRLIGRVIERSGDGPF